MSSYRNTQDVSSWDAFDQPDDEELDRSEYQFASRDHILFCIDASTSMQTPGGDGKKSAFHQALDAVLKIQRSKVITGPMDSVGVVFWNVDPDKEPLIHENNSIDNKPGMYLYQPVRQINADEIKRTLNLLNEADLQAQDDPDNEPSIFLDMFPPIAEGQDVDIGDVLATCNLLFRDAGTKIAGNKRVFLVTDWDSPTHSLLNRNPAKTIFNDLSMYGISIDTYFVNRPGHRFNPNIYWNDILNRPEEDIDDDSPDAPIEDGLADLSSIMSELVIRQAPKRILFNIPLKLGQIEIGINGYAMVSEQKKGTYKYYKLRGQQVEEVEPMTDYNVAETGEPLAEKDLGRAFYFGSEKISNELEANPWQSEQYRQIVKEHERVRAERGEEEEEEEEEKEEEEKGEEDEDEEMEVAERPQPAKPKKKFVARTALAMSREEELQLKTMGMTPQIKILGFRDPSSLKVDHNVKHSYFIYPNELAYAGSTRTFAALLKACVTQKRHGLALTMFRKNSQPEFCAMIPSEETFDEESGGQDQPPGFHLIPLPFVDDIRGVPKAISSNLTCTEEQRDAMASIMKKLRVRSGKFQSEFYPNPSLAFHYAQLQALAFDEDFDPDSIEDKALPKYQGIHKAAGAQMEKWHALILQDERATGAIVKEKAVKRPAKEIDDDSILDLWRDENVKKITVSDLRAYASKHGISLTGRTRKDDIIEAVRPHLDKAAAAEGAGEPGDADDYVDPDEEDAKTKPKSRGGKGSKKKTRIDSDDDE